ncbi:MAG: protein-glutamate O-methyltransferase CheR [Acidobacteria bacterium]|nr:protein-glutamate O-methyltransferase CheR [Acidobacteriota bacterium]MBV9144629.1 protein-glutamate O-methyltransferase CheR [Acidobacteriota bacterium]MBV9436390.1 protein-glutamate O-methyltransferase CheR [Acidobacteriota bacterium]
MKRMNVPIENGNANGITDHDLVELRHAIENRSGIRFDESRTRFLSARVRQHMSERGMTHPSELLKLVRGSNAEYERLLERVLTQETSFFRYPAMYHALDTRVLPELHAKKFWNNPRTLRIWSAGCSTGEEPYSIALTVLKALELPEAWSIEILATDISRKALDVAERGHYSKRELEAISAEQLQAHFSAAGSDGYRVKPKLRNMINFAQMNLAQMVYMGRFDCIFCMNVLIYFSDELRAALIRRFYEYLEPDGYLFLGHAESVAQAKVDLEPIVIDDSLIYRKASAARAAMQEVL